MRILLLLIVAALIAACASHPAPTAAAPGVNLTGYSLAFRTGYVDGCSSVDALRKRDEPRFKADTDYAQGWRDGYDICRHRR